MRRGCVLNPLTRRPIKVNGPTYQHVMRKMGHARMVPVPCTPHALLSARRRNRFGGLVKQKPKRKVKLHLHLHKGTLRQFGYSTAASPRKRQQAIRQAIREYGPTSVFRKLNAVWVLNRHRPVGRIFAQDKEYAHSYIE